MDNFNPYDQGPLNYDPFPNTTAGNAYGPQLPDFPANDFRQSALGSSLGGFDPSSTYQSLLKMLQPGPATQNYMDFVSHPPQQQDYGANIGQKIMAGIGALSYGLSGKPQVGAETGLGILHQPFNDAIASYQREAQALSQAKDIELANQKNASSILPDVLKMRESGYEFGINAGQKAQEIANTGSYQQGQLGNQAESNRLKALADAAQAKYQQGELGVQGMNAQTARDKALAETPATVNELNARANYYNQPRPGTTPQALKPSASAMKEQMSAAMMSDPIIMQYIKEDNNGKPYWDYQGIAADKGAFQRFQEIKRKYGLLGPGPNDIELK